MSDELTTVSNSLSGEIRSLRQQIQQQQELLNRQSAALAELERRAPGVAPAVARSAEGNAPTAATEDETHTSRRGLLKLAGLTAAGAVVAAVARQDSAAAANGDAVTVGGTFTGTASTTLSGTAGGPTAVLNHTTSRGLLVSATPGSSNGAVRIDTSGGAHSIFATSDTNASIVASSTTGVDFWAFGTGRVQLASHVPAGPPTSGSYATGEIIRDSNGSFWACTSGGTSGTWVKMAVGGSLGVGAAHVLTAPTRVANTFSGSGIASGPLAVNTETNAQVTGGTVPAGALAVQGVLVAYSPSAFATPFSTSGDAAIVKGGTSAGATVTLAWPAGAMFFSGAFIAQLSPAGQLTIGTRGSAAQFTVDITAYYR